MMPELVAPCGMNCNLCKRYLATSKGIAEERHEVKCAGCRPGNKNCAFIKKSCKQLRTNQINFCFECADFPCQRLNTLNHRYQTRYNTDLVENLKQIKQFGIEAFLAKETEKSKCQQCGGTISIHDNTCYSCFKKRKLSLSKTT